MQIAETSKATHLTKKAIAYYIEQGLICPTILENGYRDFTAEESQGLAKAQNKQPAHPEPGQSCSPRLAECRGL